MPGFILHMNASILCTHGVPAVIPPQPPRLTIMGQPAALATAVIPVVGCPFTVPGPKPQPCVQVKWLNLSARVKVMGVPVLLQTSPGPGQGLCLSAEQIPNGPPNVTFVQSRVFAL